MTTIKPVAALLTHVRSLTPGGKTVTGYCIVDRTTEHDAKECCIKLQNELPMEEFLKQQNDEQCVVHYYATKNK